MGTRIAAEDPGTVLGVWAHPDDEANVAFTGLAVDRDVAAVRAHVSQTAGRLVDEVGEEDCRRWWSAEAFVASEPGRVPRPAFRGRWRRREVPDDAASR